MTRILYESVFIDAQVQESPKYAIYRQLLTVKQLVFIWNSTKINETFGLRIVATSSDLHIDLNNEAILLLPRKVFCVK